MTIYEEEHTLTMSVVGVSGMTYTATDVSVDLGFIERTALLRDACSALAEFNNDALRVDEIVVAQDYFDIEALAQEESRSQKQCESSDYFPNNLF
ncbi:hypothetical protein PLGE761_15840 [Pluralibacter gergoviae]|uniref:hypothetical protein n=1 Tax=Pluralibacter gergoviae TaxID=61647 RepID=UPI0007DABFF7|nr:hypothetical protein [Pluralibacter gergoviae]